MRIKENKLRENYFKISPLILLIGVVPLIVFMKVVVLDADYLTYWNGELNSYDYYAYYKSIAIIVLSLICISILIYDLIINKKSIEKKYYIISGLYGGLIFLSTIFSEHKLVSTFGFVERYEGMIILLCYLMIFLCAIRFVKSENAIKLMIIVLFISAIIICIIGVSQFIGHDFFQSEFGKKMILPSKYEKYIDNMVFNNEKFKISSTLYHYNYMGSYMAMLFPLSLTLLIFTKGIKKKAIFIIPSILFFFNWIGCGSRAGFIGGTVSSVVLIILIRKNIAQNWKISIWIVCIVIALGLGLNAISGGTVFNRLKTIFSNEENPIYKDIRLESDELVFEDELGQLRISYRNGKVLFKNEDGNILKPISIDQVTCTFEDELHKQYVISNGTVYMNNKKMPILNIKKKETNININMDGNGKFKVFTAKSEFVDVENIPSIGFKGKEKMGSARGYIWSRSLPLLKDTVLLGYGPDTFAIKFPNNDYIGKLVAYDTASILVDKPHNLYLQIALSTGVISLIAFLSIMFMYIKESFKYLLKSKFDDFYSIMGASILVAIVGYLGAGFFNDSAVSVAPVFWVLLGIGVGINCKIKAE